MKINLKQFARFLFTGTNNTTIDFLILNILMRSFDIYRGPAVIFFNCLSFSIAVTNSYFINRFWVFNKVEIKRIRNIQFFLPFLTLLILINLKFLQNNVLLIFLIIVFFSLVLIVNFYIIKNHLEKGKNSFLKNSQQFGKFVFLTIIGMTINSSVLYVCTSFVTPFFGLSAVLWANLSKAAATVTSLFWDFFAYKFLIFKQR